MSKGLRIAAIALLCAGGALLLAGAALFIVGLGLEGWDVTALNNAHYETRSYTAHGEIETVRIDYENAHIRIESGESFALSYPVRTDGDGEALAEVTVTEEDGALTVTEEDSFLQWGVGFGTKTPELVLTLPGKEYGAIVASSSAGSVTAEGISAAELTLRSDAGGVAAKEVRVTGSAAFTANLGDISLQGVDAGSVTASADVGTIETEAVRVAGSAAFAAALGDISLQDIEGGSVSASADMGKVDAENVRAAGEISLSASVGNVDAEGIDGANVQLTSEMGDVRASLAGAKEAYTIRVRTEMGESNVVDRDGGSRRLTAETGMGNIRIEFLG